MTALWRNGLLVILLLATAAGLATFEQRYRDNRYAGVEQQFQLLGALRRSALDTYFSTVRAEMEFWSLSPRITRASRELQDGWQALPDAAAELRRLYIAENPDAQALAALADAGDGSAYSLAHAGLHGLAREFVTGRGYYDFFLIDPAGEVIYTVEKEDDYATSLTDGPYAESGLGEVFRLASLPENEGKVVMSDLARYAPSADAPAIFAARTLAADDGSLLGVLALQLPTDTIAGIMQFTEGMGRSGETYLVGADLLMRSDSRFSADSTILDTVVDTHTVASALGGGRGVDVTPDYRGIDVLSAYDYLDFDGHRWAVMAEIDVAEVERRIGSIRSSLVAIGASLMALIVASFAFIFEAGQRGGRSPEIDTLVDLPDS